MKPGYWKTTAAEEDALNLLGVRAASLYHVTEDEAALRIEYINFVGDGSFTSGLFYVNKTDHWTVPAKEITEKEYFVAQLRGKP